MSLREDDLNNSWAEVAALRILEEIMSASARVEAHASASLDRALARLRTLKDRVLDDED